MASNTAYSFRPAFTVFPSAMMRDVRGVVARALSNARAAGHDYVSQCRLAAAAVAAVRPDMSYGEALQAVSRLRDRGDSGTDSAG